MALFTSIAELQKAAAASSTGGGNRSFLTLKANDSYKVRFRQEVAQDGSGYDEEAGLGLMVPVHVLPGPGDNFKKKLACTQDDEAFDYKCWMHEQVIANPAWKAKSHFLINVAVLDNNEWTNMILDQGFSDKHVINTLIEFAAEYGTVTDRDYKISRKGSGMNDSVYSLLPLGVKPQDPDVTGLEFIDLAAVYRKLPYDEQAEFFLAGANDKPASESW